MRTIAIYPGSFSPLHIGHLNIIEKAERVFGKGNVIVAIGINPDKNYLEREDPKEIEKRLNRPVITYNKFLHELVEDYEKEGCKVIVIRGLRNGTDLDYQVNQFRFISDFKKDINVIYLTCDKEYEHISSSAIRKIEQFAGTDMTKKYTI